jgi:16S rRNA G966 N2-methylase RsmD
MLNSKLLALKVQTFINRHLNANVHDLALKGSPFSEVETAELMQQIQSKNKCKKKLPTWFNSLGIYYPAKLNIEQTSSEKTALYKSAMLDGGLLIDLSGGFGVDSFYFSKKIKTVVHCEIETELSEIAAHNFRILKANNIKTIATDGLEYLKNNTEALDWIYIDPSRRDVQKNKRFFIEDCTPNVTKHLDLFFKHSSQVLVKLSPMLDIHAALEVLPQTKEIHIVAVKNEVKELLFILKNEYHGAPLIKAINLDSTQEVFEFKTSDELQSSSDFALPALFLYEPNAAVLKSGAFKLVSNRFNVKKLAQHTHLYTSELAIDDFPGKAYRINRVHPYNKKKLKALLNGQKANVKTRNFPEKTEHLKTIFKLSDGGERFLFFTSSEAKKWVLDCSEVTSI